MYKFKKKKKWQKALIGIAISIGVLLLTFVALVIGLSIKDSIDAKNAVNNDTEEITTSVYEQRIKDPIPSGKDDAVDVDTTPISIQISEIGRAHV